jgi:hypothetical protein
MRNIGPRILAPHGARLTARNARLALVDLGGLDGLALEPRPQVRLVGERLALLPGRAGREPLRCHPRGLLGVGDHADEAAVARYRDDARDCLARSLVQRGQFRAR